MKESETKEKEEIRQAYENVQSLRLQLRQLARACGVGGLGSGVVPITTAKNNTDIWVAGLPDTHKQQVIEAINAERLAFANSAPKDALAEGVRACYRLVQKLPSWEGLPEGETENKLLAIKALIKTSKDAALTMNSIALVIDPAGIGPYKPQPKPKPQPQPQPKPKATLSFSASMGALMVEPPKSGSPPHLHPVDKTQEPWGLMVPYYAIKKGQPMTWGACEMWVDKTDQKPGKTGDLFFLHPSYSTISISKLHQYYWEEKGKFYDQYVEHAKYVGEDEDYEDDDEGSSDGPY